MSSSNTIDSDKNVEQHQRGSIKLASENDIHAIFACDKNKFIGEFLTDDYKIIRGYLPGLGNQLRLYWTKFEPFQTKVASLCIVHGFGEYSDRFLNIASFYAKQGFVVHMIDLRGFGYSGGARACSSIKQMHKDIEVLIKQASPLLPLFLYGHSMGGALILSFLMQNPQLKISGEFVYNSIGVITTAPELGFPPNSNLPWIKRTVIKLIGKQLQDIVANAQLNPTSLTKNEFEIRKIINDRLMIPFLGLNMARNLIMLTEYTLPNAKNFEFPILLVHGAQDQVIHYTNSVKFYENCSSSIKRIKIFEQGYHELQNDVEAKQLNQEGLAFIKELLQTAKPVGLIQKLNHGIKNKYAQQVKLFLKQTPAWKKIVSILLVGFYFLMASLLKNNPNFPSIFKRYLFPVVILMNYLKQ